VTRVSLLISPKGRVRNNDSCTSRPPGVPGSPPVECFFSVITRPAIRRGSLISVKELVAAIGTLIDHWNDHASPFAWTEDSYATLGGCPTCEY
jgi:hypothetical protein